jgi:ADP-ribosylation factor family
VFVADAAESDERMAEARTVLHEAMEAVFLQGKPLMIFVTKSHKKGASGLEDVVAALDVSRLEAFGEVHVVQCNSLGTPKKPDKVIDEGFQWVAQAVDNQYETLKARVARETELQAQKEKAEREAKRLRVEAMKTARAAEAAANSASEVET